MEERVVGGPLHGHLPERLGKRLKGCLIMFVLVITSVKFISNFLITSGDVLVTCGRNFRGCGVRSKGFHATRRIRGARERRVRTLNIGLCSGCCIRRPLSGKDAVHFFGGERRISGIYLVGKRLPTKAKRVTVSEVCTSGGGLSIKSALQDKGEA